MITQRNTDRSLSGQHNLLARPEIIQDNTLLRFTSLPFIKEFTPRLIRVLKKYDDHLEEACKTDGKTY